MCLLIMYVWVRVCYWGAGGGGRAGLGIWAVWGMLTTSEIISAALIPASACWLTMLPLLELEFYKPKFFSMYC